MKFGNYNSRKLSRKIIDRTMSDMLCIDGDTDAELRGYICSVAFDYDVALSGYPDGLRMALLEILDMDQGVRKTHVDQVREVLRLED